MIKAILQAFTDRFSVIGLPVEFLQVGHDFCILDMLMEGVRTVIRNGILILCTVQGEDDIVGTDALTGIDGFFVCHFGKIDIIAQQEVVL